MGIRPQPAHNAGSAARAISGLASPAPPPSGRPLPAAAVAHSDCARRAASPAVLVAVAAEAHQGRRTRGRPERPDQPDWAAAPALAAAGPALWGSSAASASAEAPTDQVPP